MNNERIESLLDTVLKELSGVKGELDLLKQNTAQNFTSISYGDWLTEWLELYKLPTCKYNYYKSLVGYVNKYIRPAFGERKLVDITPLELQRFVQSIPFSCTRTHVAAVLSDSMGRAYKLRLIPFNPYLAVVFKHYEPPTLGALTHAQQLELLGAVCEPKKTVLTWLLLCTGLRQGEALALTPQSIDFKRKTLRVEHSLERVTNALVSPKTKSGVRTVPIDEPLISMLRPYAVGSERIFSENTPGSLSRYYRRLFSRLDMDFSGHILRHTFITNAYELQIPDYIVQRWVGHAKRAQADTYLALRSADDFIVTPIVEYMLRLKARFVV